MNQADKILDFIRALSVTSGDHLDEAVKVLPLARAFCPWDISQGRSDFSLVDISGKWENDRGFMVGGGGLIRSLEPAQFQGHCSGFESRARRDYSQGCL